MNVWPPTGSTAHQPSRSEGLHALLGPVLALLIPTLYVLFIGPNWLEPRLGDLSYAVLGTAVFWTCALSTLAVVRFGEGRRLSSLGFRRPSRGILLLAVGIGIGLSLSVPVLSQLAALFLPTSAGGGIIDATTRFPAWFLLINVVSVATCEEILFRAYPLERIRRPGRFPAWGVLIGFGTFVMVHAPGWNAAHIVGVVVPLGAVLTALYLWKRNVWFVMIIHLLINLPLVVLALL